MIIPPIVVPVALEIAKSQFKKYMSKDHGSKVKMGEFAEAAIEMFGNKACIKLDEAGCHVLLLTSDTIQRCEYVKEKKRLRGGRLRTYFYYNIYFKDGTSSYVRMRRKYRDAMMKYL